jgi:hypothetical protein
MTLSLLLIFHISAVPLKSRELGELPELQGFEGIELLLELFGICIHTRFIAIMNVSKHNDILTAEIKNTCLLNKRHTFFGRHSQAQNFLPRFSFRKISQACPHPRAVTANVGFQVH